ncbi:PREDICTED: uncharacterized protein LOC106111871 isoform X2 [Papilio polytes]|uniref:uncharacterized protein LOC106111871 isoform X2 n=1 Tax=Papilio polytes TaxID=76194 RepID=UPI000675C2EF|nr:PREDICTED: uncharacterized protein LOC106111871 isoform X2 [Papilio polytes]
MAILEKFKKQIVQDLARHMIEENEPRDQMWSRLKDEYGLDCKLLWERIGTLTKKKLSKLLDAEDRTELIPDVAQMTQNDWLVFDKVLVHENVDVIGKPSILNGHPESKVLWELYILVSSYNIENLPPEEVAKGWHNLTKVYNTSGRYCSAMLLQLRWYQLKELVRTNFHNFWSIYQGKSNFMDQVPRASKLQKLIASRYGNILTGPFIPWKCLIKINMVVKDSDLETCRQLDQSETSNDDVEIIEIKPSIETIDLNTDSESEDGLEKETTKQSISGINDIDLLEPENTYISDLNYQEDKDTLTPTIFPKIVNVKGKFDIENSELLVSTTEQHQDLIRKVIKTLEMERTVENIKFTDEQLLQCKDLETVNQCGQVNTENDKITVVKLENNCEEENYSSQTIDPKLLLFPISYTKKLDHMSMFKNTNYFKIKGNNLIKCIEAESKPMILKYDYSKYEIPQINSSREMRQKQKKRTYSSKQLRRNPDFFVELKNIPVNFFLSERNRRLLNYCKPVTVDIDRLIETKRTNNPNLEDLSNRVKQTKESYEFKNSDYILGKSIEDINASLQHNEINKSEKSSNDTENDRNVEKLGQTLLAIEVSPLFSNNYNTNPPVKLVQLEKDVPNHKNAKKIDDYVNTSSDISLIKESPVDKSKVNIKQLLPQQNKTDKSYNVPKTNSVIKLVRCPVDTFNNYEKLKESKLGSDVKKLRLAEQAAEILGKQRITQVVPILIDHPLKKIAKTRVTNQILPNNSRKEVLKLIKGPIKKADTVQVPKSNMPLQNSVALFLENVTNDEKTGISDQSKKSKILYEGVTKITSSTNTRDKSISGESKNCKWDQNEVQKQENNKKLRHLCTKLCECTEYRNNNKSCANDRSNDLNNVATCLPHQNPMINLQCQIKQNSLYLVVSPLENNSDQDKSISTNLDKHELDSGKFKMASFPNSLLVTRVSSESAHSSYDQNDQNEIKELNSNSELNVININSDTKSTTTSDNVLFVKAKNKEIVGRIEAKNGNIQIIPCDDNEKEEHRESKRKLTVDLTDICDSRQAKRKANTLV